MRNNSLLCVGLDPRPERTPEDAILSFNKRIIDATRDLVCAYKPNIAFYEAQGIAGLQALQQTIDYIGPDIPVILDAKRGDIGSTAAAYAQAVFDVWSADAVTVTPYLGGDSVLQFTTYKDRAAFVLCHTSNPSASELQTLTCDGEPLYHRVARLSAEWSAAGPSGAGNVGLVVGATYPEALRAIRHMLPQTWFLVPGIGAQGGDLEAAVAAGLRTDGLGMVINVSRAVYYADDPRTAATALRDQINAARKVAAKQTAGQRKADGPSPALQSLILDLARIGAVRFGKFTLKSGKISPIYIDLRLLTSHPDVLSRAAAAYADLLHNLAFDCLAAIPYAALPIGTAVALQTGHKLIYPRKEAKQYGTRRAIEGVFEAGERAVVLDDLITTGGSKIEAIQPLQDAGLSVQDVVVLIDRESGGRQILSEKGYHLHAVLTLHQILDVLAEHHQISAEQKSQVLNWLQEN